MLVKTGEKAVIDMMDAIFQEISADPFQECGSVFIYGAGVQCRETIKYFEKRHKNIVLADSSEKKWGTQVAGYRVMSPCDMVKELGQNDIVVIGAVFNQYEIAVQLIEKWNINREQIFTYTCDIFEKDVYCHDLILQHQNEIEQCFEMLEDDASREYYTNSLRGRLSRRPYYLRPNSNMTEIGIYGPGIVGYRKNDTIVDCGAFTGDTAELYCEALEGMCKIYAIEPFLENYQKMLDRLGGHCISNAVHMPCISNAVHMHGICRNVICLNAAVGDKREKSFIAYDAEDNPMGMAVGIGGELQHEIEVETIDHLFMDEPVHYIKMDIEGWELKALKGAAEVIKRDKPQMMISAYHKISDFWEIPLYVKSIVPDYKIYVGHAPGVSLEMEYYLTV